MSFSQFKEIKQRVSMPEVLERYGIRQTGQKAVCPFHNDRHPSMQVYRDGFYCFTCGAGGDVVSFVSRLYGIGNSEAAERLNQDFGLGLSFGKKPKYGEMRKWKAQQQKRQNDDRFLHFAQITLTLYRRQLWRARINGPDDPLFMESLQHLETTDYYLAEFIRDKQAFLTPEMREVIWRVSKQIERIAELRGITGP